MKLSAVTTEANIKNRWNTLTSPYVFMVCTGTTLHLWLLHFSYLEWGKPVFS
jgi:phosphopantetheinyl transferase